MGDRVGWGEVEGASVGEYGNGVEGVTEHGADDKGRHPEEPRKGQVSRMVR